MESLCSLHCGHFTGIDKDAFTAQAGYLRDLFAHVDFNEDRNVLDLTGATGLEDWPEELTTIFDSLSRLLSPKGRGSIVLRCENVDICFLRRGMWKLVHLDVPPDPFDDIRYVDQNPADKI